VAELARDPVGTTHQRAPEDDAAADAGTDGEQHHGVVRVTARAELELGPGGGVRVVLDDHRKAHLGGDVLAQRLVAPGEVRCELHGRARGVDPAGGTDPDGPDRVHVGQLHDHLGDHAQRLRGVVGRRRPAGLRQHLTVHVDDAAEHFGTADVDTDRQRRVPLSS
jgi:hypothetical protein